MKKFIITVIVLVLTLIFSCVYATGEEKILLVEISDIDYPYTIGSELDTKAEVSDESKSIIYDIEWNKELSGQYTVKVSVRPYINYIYDENTKATVNGKAANKIEVNDKGILEVSYTFPKDTSLELPNSSATLTHVITVYTSKNGQILPNRIRAPHRKNFTVQIVPDEGYEVSDVIVDGNSIGAVTEYTFIRVDTTHKIRAYFKPIKGYTPSETDKEKINFIDIKESDWFYESIEYVCLNDIFKGINESEFAPNLTMTRAMLAQVICNIGKNSGLFDEIDEDTIEKYFIDVNKEAWYYGPIEWTRYYQIIAGYNDGSFMPDNNVTREQVCQILYSLEKSMTGMSTKYDDKLSEYSDATEVSSYAVNAINWAISNNIITGKSENKLDAKGEATRAEIATMVMRYMLSR